MYLPLKHKSETFDAFKKFKTFVEKESWYEIKSLRTNRGGEFTSNELKFFFFELNGFCRPLIVPKSPQHNGVTERMNRNNSQYDKDHDQVKEHAKGVLG